LGGFPPLQKLRSFPKSKVRYFRDKDLEHYRNGDTLMVLFNSLMLRETSLFFEINSLFPILGNSEKKHRWLLGFLMG
jgi:hypothetical protein